MRKGLVILFLLSLLGLSAHAEKKDLHAEADRPGMGTGTNVLSRGFIQWETGFEVAHYVGAHMLTLPTSLFRFGLCPWAEMRLTYIGLLALNDHPVVDDEVPDALYSPMPLFVGSKFKLWGGSSEPHLRWIPRVSLMLDLGLPLTKSYAEHHPITGLIDFLFENDLTNWLTLGYDLGIYWEDWAPTPDIFASLSFNFMPTDKLGVFVESYNYFDPDAFSAEDPSRTYTMCDISLDFGLTYMVRPDVQLDAYAGFNMYHTEPFLSSPRNDVYIGFGVTWLLYHPAGSSF